MKKVTYFSALVGAAFMVLMPMAVQAQVPTIRIIDWVQGRPEIPHPAVNGQDTMLQAILEARQCGTGSGAAQFRWDYNADGDFADGGEGWTDAGVNSGTYYFHYAMKNFRLPTFLGDTVTYPKIQARCRGTNPADPPSAVMPVLVRVDRMCPEYPQKRDGGCGPDDNLLLTKQTVNDRAVDRAMWWLLTQFTHWSNDEHGHNVHTCQFDNYFGHGQALNVFIRRSHGAGPFRALDPLFDHVVQCGIENNFNSWSYNGGSYRLASRRLGHGANWMSYASTALGEPVAGFGDGNYVALAGEGNIHGRSVSSIAQGIANGLIDCAGSHHGGRYWHYSCGTSNSEDLSTSGWAPETLRIMTRKLGTDTARMRGWHMTWLRPSTSHGNNHGANRDDGGCGCQDCCRGFGTSYHVSASGHLGYRAKLAGNALVSYGYANSEVYSPDIYGGTDCWNCDINWQLREHWIGLSRLHITDGYNGTGSPWGMYYLYAATKGLRSYVPEIRYLASFQSSSGYQTRCNRGDHDACDLTTTGYDINENYGGGCGNDADCKAGNYCRSGTCKVVLEEGVCLAAHYKHASNDGNVSSGTGRTDHWQCSRDWALEFAQFLVPKQHSSGYFNNYDQYGFGRKDTNILTALSAQIIQTWLETWAIARAIPQATTPGIPVTFNHSWSHILDPGTHIKQYQWDINSLDGLWWQDRNCNLPKQSQASCTNDGAHNYRFQYPDPNNPNFGEVLRDEKVVGFVTRDVGRKGDYNPGNYFSAQELMDMVMTDFTYTYTSAISWDDVAKIKVTLRTIDTEDRPVVDDKSVSIKLSYDNHKPVIVAHPLGSNEIYSGYLGLPMLLDAKTGSYDVDQCVKDKFGNPIFGNCGNREVFPGNDEKPAGFPDKITKICFDLNRNGTFCEGGEIQTDLNAIPPIDEPGVTFTPEAGVVKVGELTGIPVMVCDDGRWNGRCWGPGDGAPAEFTAGQAGMPSTCTLCAYGSASVKAVENVAPPQVPDWQPDPRKAEATLVLDTSPADDESFDLTDHTGRTTRFVFDSDSDRSDGSRQVPFGKIAVSGRPVDGETFVISDYANKDGIYFVFLDDTDNADGAGGPKTIIGIPHVKVGFKTAVTPAAVAQRIASAINSKGIDTPGYDPNDPSAAILPLNVRADVVGTEVRLTMINNGAGRGADPLRPDHTANFPQLGGPDPSPSYYQYVNMDLVTNAEGTNFAGGMIVGMQNTQGNVEKIMENLANAIIASDLAFSKVTHVGRAVELEQSAVGFNGNTQVSTDNVSGLRTQERGEAYCGNFGQTCCDGVSAPKCGDGSGCVSDRCVTYGGTYAQDGADNCVVKNSIMLGESNEADGCVCPEGLNPTKIGEFDQAVPANPGGAAERFVKVYTCSPGGPVTYAAAAQGDLPAIAELPYSDFQGGYGKTYDSGVNGFTCLQGEGLIKTIKPLPSAQCPETGFDLNNDGDIDRMQPFAILGVRHSDPEEQCVVKAEFCVDTLVGSKPDNYTFGGLFTSGGPGAGIVNALTGAKNCPAGFNAREIPMLLRHPNGGDNTMNATPGSLVMCERKPPVRYVDLPGAYEYPTRTGGKSTFFAGHDGAFVDNVLGGLNGGGGMAVWRVQPGNVLELDFSSIIDPEGVLGAEIATNGVRMIYEILPPDGLQLPAGVDPGLKAHVLRPSVGYENRVSGAVPNHLTDNFGMKPLLEPSGDGVQYFRIKVSAYDAGNKGTNRTFTVKLDNRAPRVKSFQVQPFPLPPTLPYETEQSTGYLKTIRDYCARQNPPVPNCAEPYANLPDPIIRRGNGTARHQYAVSMTAYPNSGVGLLVSFVAEEDYDEPLTASATFITDSGSTDGGTILGKTGTFRSVYTDLPPYRENADGTVHPSAIQSVRVELVVSDGEDTITEFKDMNVAQPPPALLEELEYNLNINSDATWEITDQEDPIYWELNLPIGSKTLPMTVKVLNNDMLSSMTFNPNLPNTPPGLGLGISSQEGRDVTISIAGGDLDWDPLIYSVNWGDGTPVSRGTGNIYSHTYPVGLYGDFTITGASDDSRPEGRTEKTVGVSIEPPGSKEADITGLSWTLVSLDTGLYDGVGSFDIDSAGTAFTHNYSSEIRRYKAPEIAAADAGPMAGSLVLANIECCGGIVSPSAGEVYIAAPNGFYYIPGANGDNPGAGATQLNPGSYHDVAVTANWGREAAGDEAYILASNEDGELERWTKTHDKVDDSASTTLIGRKVEKIETCKGPTTMTAIIARSTGQSKTYGIFINTTPDASPDGWVIGPTKLAKGFFTSISYDRDCTMYIGGDGGYFSYDHSTGLVEPAGMREDTQLTYVAGWDLYSAYVGSGHVRRVIAWPGGKPVLTASPRGIYGSNVPWSAITKPYWSGLTDGMVGSRSMTEMILDPVSGNILASTSAATSSPKYCRRRIRGRRRKYRYYFCGFFYNYSGGLYRTKNSLLSSRTLGAGGIPFNLAQASGMRIHPISGGVVVDTNVSEATPLWQVNTLESTVSRWDTVVNPPQEIGRFRVGLPGGECSGNDSPFTSGCNNPSRMAVDNVGDVYIASAGYDMQGSVTKIASNVSRCVDRNSNGTIDTSIDAMPLPYTMPNLANAIGDECVLWTAAVGVSGKLIRSLVVGVGDAANPDGYPWVGTYSDRKLYRLNPKTGVVMNSHDLDIEPFGAVLIGENVVVSTLGTASVQVVSTRGAGTVMPVKAPADALLGGCTVDNSYGIGADSMGQAWLSGWDCPYALGYNVAADTWCRVSLPFGRKVGRGISGDLEGIVWAAVGGDGQSYLAKWRGDRCQADSISSLGRRDIIQGPWGANGPTGVNVDAGGKVWLSHYLSPVLMSIDTKNNNASQAWQTNNVYSFSDSTGAVRRLSIGSGSYTQDYESPCENGTRWGLFSWDADVPALGSLRYSVGTAATASKLNESTMIPFVDGAVPPQVVQDYFTQNLNPEPFHSFLRIRIDMAMGTNRESPVLRSMTVSWECL